MVVDNCAHSQRDDNNMVGGCTAIVTLMKAARCDQEKEVVTEGNTQYHILPSYKPAEVTESCDEVMGGMALDLPHGSSSKNF